MKSSKVKKSNGSTDATTVVAEPVVLAPLEITEPDCADAASRIKFHLQEARSHGRAAIAHIIEAGHELAIQKKLLGFGQWSAWCEEKIAISQKTADRYIATFERTVGVLRSEQGVPLEKKILKKELEAATVGLEQKSATQAMIEMGIVKRSASWGGSREGAGRKAKSESETVAEKLEAIAQNETLLWSALKGALDTLVKMDAEKDIWNRLDDNHLATAVGILAEVAKKSSETMMNRIG